ncbi:alpha/beta hydrolase [Rhodocytophaga rosea]|uniref:Alpha/beta hydrolase n=1 Tax=Rhodocytophaga rosea TaxID=2704465 RepID=A0A6C0GSZ2_9BACT|nr:alpha/beta hydrolase [Rhodocytophaga rosea]QHT71275.1 alpha/beta hydrolase [Rhodocytophaga rosea]
MPAFRLLLFIWIILCPVFNSYAQQNTSATGKHFTSFDSTRIYYEVQGTGKPVVLIHGFIVNSTSWKSSPVYDSLQRNGFQLITLDLRGNGNSDKPHENAKYADNAEIKDIMALAKLLKLKKYDVVGYSRGAIVGAKLMVTDPKVNKVVLGGMGADFTNPDWPRRKLFYQALSGEPVKELEAMVKHVQQSGLDQTALAFSQKEQPVTTPQELAKVQHPVLVISGDVDNDNGSAEELAKLIKQSKVVRVPGNHGNTMRSAEFAREITQFLKGK